MISSRGSDADWLIELMSFGEWIECASLDQFAQILATVELVLSQTVFSHFSNMAIRYIIVAGVGFWPLLWPVWHCGVIVWSTNLEGPKETCSPINGRVGS